MKRILSFGFLLMGFSFTVTQGLMIRELLASFIDNSCLSGSFWEIGDFWKPLAAGSWADWPTGGAGRPHPSLPCRF